MRNRNVVQLISYFMVMLSFAFSQVTIDGYAFLDGQTDHSGIQVQFARTAPSILSDSVLTDIDGYFSIQLEVGVYNITYSRESYLSRYLFEQALYSNITIPEASLIAHTTLINIPADIPTIQLGINEAVSGDTVLVAPGTYIENINFLGKGIVLGSLFITTSDTLYIDSTIIDGNQNGSVVTFENVSDTTTVFCGFTVTNGLVINQGGGIYCNNSNPTIRNLIVKENYTNGTWGGGAGIYSDSSNLKLESITVSGNRIWNNGNGGGISSYNSSITMNNVNISRNFAISGLGGGFYSNNSTINIANTIIEWNSSNQGGGINSNQSVLNFDEVSLLNNSNGNVNGGGGLYSYNSELNFSGILASGNYTSGSGGGMYIYGCTIALLDMSIVNNTADQSGGGISIAEGTVGNISNSTVTDNEATNGSGININSGTQNTLSFTDITVAGNVASSSGGGFYMVYSTTGIEITNSSVNRNTAVYGGGIYLHDSSNPILTNTMVYGNTAAYGGGLYCKNNSNPTIRNVTITGNNGTSYGGGIYCLNSSDPVLTNSIVSHNIGGHGIYAYSSNPSISYSDFWDNELGNYHGAGEWIGENVTINSNGDSCDVYSNIQIDPSYIDSEHDNYQIEDYSHCIGAGTLTGAPVADIEGSLRPSPTGSNPDIGAYENLQAAPQRMPVTINIPVDYATIQAGLNVADSTDMVLVQPGTYYENIFWPETNGIQLISAGDASNTIIDGSNISSVIYMNPQTVTIDTTTLIRGFKFTNGGNVASGGGIFISSAAPLIENVSVSANSCTSTGGGIYSEGQTIIRSSTIADNTAPSKGGGAYLLGGTTLDNVVISGNIGNNRGGGLHISGNTIISNVEVQNNYAWNGGGLYIDQGTHTISNSRFHQNESLSSGGGIFSYGNNISFEEIILSNNTALGDDSEQGSGGGMFIHGSPVLTNVTAKYNRANYGNGGGISIADNPTITGLDLYGNYCSGSGGGLQGNGQISINDFLIINNTADDNGGGIFLQSNSSTLRNGSVGFNQANTEKGGGLYIYGQVDLSQLTIANNTSLLDGGGIYFRESQSTIDSSNIISNESSQGVNGIYNYTGTLSIMKSNLLNNGYAIYNADNSSMINGSENWWNDPTGPYHATQNTEGVGDSTNNFVNVTPWRSSTFLHSPPISPLNVQVEQTGNDFISISWDTSGIGDIANIKIYWDSDSSGYPYSNSTVISSSDSYILSGLSVGTNYYCTVSTIDSDGNESLHSEEVEGVTRVIEVQNLDISGDEELQHLVTHVSDISFEYYDSMSEAQTHYQLQVSTHADYSSISVWDTGEVTSDATTITYSGDALQDGQAYYLRAKVGVNDFWSEWSDLSFRMNTEPSSPIQVSLINDAVATGEVLLIIDNSLDAEEDDLTYNFRLYSDETLAVQLDSAITVSEGTEETTWTVVNALADNEQFWWTVQAYDGYEYSTVAGPESFLVNSENDIPGNFSLLFPGVEEEITSLSPLLRWEPAIDPDPIDTISYVLYLDTPDPGVETFNIGTDTSYQVVTDLQDDTDYSWKVIASDLNGASTENTSGYQSFRVNTENDLPTAFDLLAPEDGSMVNDLTPTLIWEPSSDPDDGVLANREVRPIHIRSVQSTNSIREVTAYQVYLDTDSLFTGTEPTEVFSPEFTPATDLVENMIYYWKIEAFDDDGGTLFSDRWSFWTNAEKEAPTEFSLLVPAADEVLTELNPTFTWEPTSDPDINDGFDYNLVLGTDPGNMDTIWSGTDTTLSLGWDLEDNQTYYWIVYAQDWSGLMTFNTGGYQSFTVNTANDLPVAFNLLYPVSDEMVTNLQPEFLWEESSDPDDEAIVMREVGRGKFKTLAPTGNNSITVITGYNFYLGTDVELTDVIPADVIGTRYTPVEELVENQVYYWAVSAVDDSGGVTFSDTASFWTNADNEAPAEFSLLLPAVGEVLTVLSPTFVWEPSHDPDLYDGFGYHILLGSNPEDMDTLWSGGDTTLTLDWELDDNMTYYWAVFAEDWSGLITFNSNAYQSFTVNQGNDAPSMVELVAPDSVMVLTLTPEMVWSPAMDADPNDTITYEMHWWGEGIEFDSILTDTNAVFVTSELEDNTQYFWEVIAMDQTDGISYSEAATFWTNMVAEAPGVFALLSPEDDVVGLSDMPSFEWEPSNDPDPMDFAIYTIQVATDSNFVDIVFDANTELDVVLNMTEALPADTEYWWRVVATDIDSLTTESETFKFTVGYVAIAEALALPTEFVLDQNFPNPFNPSTTLRYGIPEDSDVSLIIYDIRGNTVRSIESGAQVAGWYEHIWNGLDDEGQPISTGLYIARLSTPSFIKSIKMVYLK